jgi:hypothetical protein
LPAVVVESVAVMVNVVEAFCTVGVPLNMPVLEPSVTPGKGFVGLHV